MIFLVSPFEPELEIAHQYENLEHEYYDAFLVTLFLFFWRKQLRWQVCTDGVAIDIIVHLNSFDDVFYFFIDLVFQLLLILLCIFFFLV